MDNIILSSLIFLYSITFLLLFVFVIFPRDIGTETSAFRQIALSRLPAFANFFVIIRLAYFQFARKPLTFFTQFIQFLRQGVGSITFVVDR